MIKKIKKEELNNDFYDLYYEGFLYHYNKRPDLFKKRTLDELKEWLFSEIDNEGLKILGYFKDDKLIGFLAYKIVQKTTKYLWIDEFIISKNERGKGYGTALMNEARKISKEENTSRVEFNCYAFNENAIKLYKKLGYVEQRYIFEMKNED